MNYLSTALDYINPFSLITNILCSIQTNNTDVTNTITISKHIFDNCFDNRSFPLPYHNDIWKKIFSNLNFRELKNLASVSIECCRLVNEPSFSKDAIYCDFSFNPSHWNQFFGLESVSNDENKKAIDSLPKNINEILMSPCPAFAGKRVMDTHMLVWIPESVRGKPLTINSFGLLLKQYPEFSKSETGYQFICDQIVQKIGDNAIQPGWVLMTTDVVPGSRENSFDEQKELVANLNKDGQTDYRVPNAGEAIVSISTKNLISGTKKCIFSLDPLAYTRCQENIQGVQLVLGGCSPALSVGNDNRCVHTWIGVAGLRKF